MKKGVFKLSRLALLSATVPLVALSLYGCAEERAPVDRVQPNVIDKKTLTDEWYYQRTVVAVPAANGFTFVGSADFNGLSRITWDIQEKYLFGRRTSEKIEGADDRERREAEGEPYRGEVIAAFAISSHFDISHDYNPVTGEQLNVLVENTRDRPWYDRQYMRVDWSQNLVHNYELDFEAQSVESVPYFVQEIDPLTGKRHADAPYFEGDGSYFDVTTKLFAKAGTFEYPGYGTIPVCWLFGEEFTECGSGEYTIRHSFFKVDTERQYEPFPYAGKASEVFGFFTNDRMVFDEREGIREQAKKRFLTRHNLWKKSWKMVDGEKRPIPYSEREIRPIVYHVNPDWPEDDEDLNYAAQHAADQWNEVFTDVVKAMGKDPGDQKVYILCPHNPVRKGDPKECGKEGLAPRLGDIRYSFMAYVPDYMTYGLLGLGPSNSDPETGEIISGVAHVYTHNNGAAFKVQEMVELLNGDRPVDTYIEGVDLQNWMDQFDSNSILEHRTFGLDDAQYFVHKMTHGDKAQYWDGRRHAPTVIDETMQKRLGVRKWMQPYLDRMYREGIHNGETALALSKARLARLQDTEFEDMMLNDEVLMGVGHPRELPVTDEVKERASVARGGFASFMKDRSRILEKYAAAKTVYLPDMADDALLGLARDMKGQGISGDELYHKVRKTIYTAVLTHEVGHTLGLMHNFGGSDDAMNYFDEYWEIRSHDGTTEPRLIDPITTHEINSHLYNYAYSSIMDYAGRYTIDGAGAGRYDRAALLFGYGNKVEVFENTHGVDDEMFFEWYDSDGDIVNFYNAGPQAYHYTEFYKAMGEDLYADSNRTLVDVSELKEDFSATLDGKVRVPYVYCSHSRYNLGDSCLTRDFGADSYERMKNILDELNTWYISRNFPRGQIGVDTHGYVNRWYGRIYNRIKQWNDIYGLYADFLPQFYEPDQLEAFFNDPVDGWGTKTWAVQNGFNYLVQSLLMPDVGSGYGLVKQPDGTELAESQAAQIGGFNVDVTAGRYYSTNWHDGDRQCGYFWWECLHHVGFYLDKIMAIEAMSDADTNFVGRSTPEDIREWQVSYYSTFPEQIAAINTAMLSNQWNRVAPYYDGNQVKFPNYTGDLTEVHATPINPMATFTIQLYWQALGLTRFSDNFDTRFVEESRIYYYGFGPDTAIPDDRKVVFMDPQSGVQFSAPRYDVEGSTHKGASQSVLERANFLVARSSMCDDEARTTFTEDDCAPPPSGVSRARVTAELRSYVELIKTMVRLKEQLDLGDPYNP